MPRTAYSAAGARGQRTIIIPSHDLVVVRMGYSLNERAYIENLGKVVSGILEAVHVRTASGTDRKWEESPEEYERYSSRTAVVR